MILANYLCQPSVGPHQNMNCIHKFWVNKKWENTKNEWRRQNILERSISQKLLCGWKRSRPWIDFIKFDSRAIFYEIASLSIFQCLEMPKFKMKSWMTLQMGENCIWNINPIYTLQILCPLKAHCRGCWIKKPVTEGIEIPYQTKSTLHHPGQRTLRPAQPYSRKYK